MTNEVYEVAVSEDGSTYGPFEQFTPGDVRLLDNFVKFRVTVFGDFEDDEYRLRGFSGIVDDATTSVGGFGVTPFGRFPFGDGGICLEDSGGTFEGQLHLTGTLDIAVAAHFDVDVAGSLALTGGLQTNITAVEDGSLALTGTLGSVLTSPSAGAMPGFITGGSVGFVTSRYFSLTTQMGSGTMNGAVDVQIPIAIVITKLYVKLQSALGAGPGVLTAKITVNGVDSGAIIVTMNTGDLVGSGSGVLSVNANDKICVRITTSAASGSVSVNSITAAYRAA
jgi:hypothetical protein